MKTNTLYVSEYESFNSNDIQKALGRESSAVSNPQEVKSAPKESHPNQSIKNTIDSQAQKIFDECVKFAQGKDNDKFLKFQGSKTLKTQNYVGLIQTKSGFCLEILPKIFNKEGFENGHLCDKKCESEYLGSKESQEKLFCQIEQFIQKHIRQDLKADNENLEPKSVKQDITIKNADSKPKDSKLPCQIAQAKSILLNCLRTLKDSPFRHIDTAHIKSMNMPLLEIFAMSFLNECEKLIKRGIRKDYVSIEENRHFLKGKLLFNENLKYNFAHKERFYTAFDEFSPNIAPNRLIVSTLHFFKKQNFSQKTKERLNQLLFIFEEIPPSHNIKADFDKCHQSRYFSAYKLILQWCEVFLNHKSFAPYSGDSINFALLFPMEKLFESFVAFHLKKYAGEEVKTQERSKHLIEFKEGNKIGKLFQLKPDIVIYRPNKANSKKIIIADTKWKVPSSQRDEKGKLIDEKSGVSQGDLYQMFAYASKYKAKEVILIYPLCEQTKILKNKWDSNKEWTFKANDIRLKLAFFPLY